MKTIYINAFLSLSVLSSMRGQANSEFNSQETKGYANLIEPKFNAQKFIDFVSFVSISETETAKLALRKSTSSEIKIFAQQAINDQATVIKAMRVLATEQHLVIASDVELPVKASMYIPARPGQTFDLAYVNKRLVERKKVVAAYRDAIKSNDKNLRDYAIKNLPFFMRDWYQAQKLVQKTSDISVTNAKSIDEIQKH